MVGNTITRIFTYGDFVKIIPVRSKPEYVMILDRINWCIEVENEIFVDNAPNQTGYNIEVQRVARLKIMDVRATEPLYPCQNKVESVINLVKVKSNKIRVQINITKRVWEFCMVWVAEIYSRTTGKDGHQTWNA